MPSFNKVVLMGNLTRDPQLKHLPSNLVVVDFGLACNRRYRTAAGEDKEEVAFVDCAAFGRQAEVIQKYCKKGKSLYIEGRLRFDSWDDKNGHGKRSKLSVVVENFQFIGSREGGGGGGGGGAPSYDEHDTGDQGGGGGGGGYQQRRPAPQANRGPQGGPPAQRPAPRPQQQPEPPFSENQEFKEDDIPF